MVITPPTKPDRPNGVDVREQIVSVRENSRSEKGFANAFKRANLVDHALAQHALAGLRNRHTSTKGLRQYSHQLLTILSLEATRNLPTQESELEGLNGTCGGKILSRSIVFISLSRHGLGLTHDIADVIPELCIGSITLESSSAGRLEPRMHLANVPSLSSSRVILFDPVVSSGISAGIALNLLKNAGASDLTLISFVMSAAGLKRVQSTVPEVNVWTAAIDEALDPKKGPLPGIGNLGERLYI